MIPLYFASADDNRLIQFDDPTLDDDDGAAFTARLTTSPCDAGPASGFSHLRRLAQAMSISGAVAITLTPIADGAEATQEALTLNLVTPNGIDQQIESNVALGGTRFQWKMEVTSHVGPTALGEADIWFRPRRSTRSP